MNGQSETDMTRIRDHPGNNRIAPHDGHGRTRNAQRPRNPYPRPNRRNRRRCWSRPERISRWGLPPGRVGSITAQPDCDPEHRRIVTIRALLDLRKLKIRRILLIDIRDQTRGSGAAHRLTSVFDHSNKTIGATTRENFTVAIRPPDLDSVHLVAAA